MDRIISAAMGLVIVIWVINRMQPDLLPAGFSAFLPSQTVS